MQQEIIFAGNVFDLWVLRSRLNFRLIKFVGIMFKNFNNKIYFQKVDLQQFFILISTYSDLILMNLIVLYE